MSWDVLLLKEKIDLNEKNVTPVPLGNKSVVIPQLTTLLPGLDFSNTSWGIYATEAFSIELNTGDKDMIDVIMLHIRGGGNPLEVIKTICDNMHWVALDCSTGEFMNTSNMSAESWERHQQYVSKIIQQSSQQ